MNSISLAQANAIIEGSFSKGLELGMKPLAVVVLDAGGHDIAVQRQDGASILRPQIARAKASGALGLGMSSRKISDIAAERPTFVAALGVIAPLGALPAAGGLIVVDAAGSPIGAVGITGDTSDNDELCAAAGIVAAGLTVQA
jgi:uncharacterized protein GlcG (DUF336 family)